MNYLLLPPIAFLIVLGIVMLQAYLMTKFAAEGKDSMGKTKAYACGEDSYDNKVQPDYRQFFSFAFFFTIMHVVVMVVATAPMGLIPNLMAAVYIIVAVVGLLILFRR